MIRGYCFREMLLFFFMIYWKMSTSGGIAIDMLKPNEVAILQFDSREPSNYWLASAKWNSQYCKIHGHLFLYYSSKEGCYHGNEKLATPWCKVKAMLAANEEYPQVKLFIYMDSDAVVNKKFSDMPMNSLLSVMQRKLSWNPDIKPVIFNQDAQCHWCETIVKAGYTMCLNAGTVVWYRHKRSEEVLNSWWDSSMDDYATNPMKRPFRVKWPWEQDRQQAVFNRSSQFIQIASQPDRIYQQGRNARIQAGNDWCLSHLPNANCFISHYCAHKGSKQDMRVVYAVGNNTVKLDSNGKVLVGEETSVDFDFAVHYLTFDR